MEPRATLRGAFGLTASSQAEQVALSSVEFDVLRQATSILESEMQTPGVQQAQDLIHHVLDCGSGYSDGPQQGP